MLENPKAQEARAWLTARLEQDDLGEEERDLLTRVAQFPFERYPDYTCPWHLLKWPHQRWEYTATIIDIIESFKHVKGSFAGKRHLTLEPFQVLILLCFLAPYNPETDHRLVRTMLLTIARKNAKSTLTAASITAAMAIRPEAGGFYRQDIYVGASDREQAGEIYEMSSGFITQDQSLGLARKFRCTPSSKVVQHYDTLTKLKVLSSDAYRAHGRNAVAVVYDEIGNLPSEMATEFYNVLTSGFGAQEEAMAWLLSTQAPTDSHVFSSMVDACKRKNEGKPSDLEDMAGFVFEVPDRVGGVDIDPFDEQHWYLANPGLLSSDGLAKTLLPDLRRQASEARELPSLEGKFRNRRLNQRANPHSPVISASRWKACSEPAFSLSDLRGGRCWVGLDLSSVQDLTAAVVVFEPAPALNGRRAVSAMFWAPRRGLEAKERQDKVPYLTWAREGYINVEADKIIEYTLVARWLADLAQDFEVVGIGYDRWRAEDFKVAAREVGIGTLVDDEHRFVEIYQSARYVEPCIEALERALALEQITHGNNPVLTWCASNALAVRNTDGHRKWDKAKSYGRIDGMVALGMALRCEQIQQMGENPNSAAESDEFVM